MFQKGHILNFYEHQKQITHKYKEQKSLLPLVCMRKDLTGTVPSGVTCSIEYMIRCYDHQISNIITAS